MKKKRVFVCLYFIYQLQYRVSFNLILLSSFLGHWFLSNYKRGRRVKPIQTACEVQCSDAVHSNDPTCSIHSNLPPPHLCAPIGAETHSHTEAPTVAANWTDSLAIDLLQVSSLCKILSYNTLCGLVGFWHAFYSVSPFAFILFPSRPFFSSRWILFLFEWGHISSAFRRS